jgi:AcrR family transcriptional regulator
MKQTPADTQTRLSAEERREAILQAAIHEFAILGLHGTSTDAIATRVGISQPYIFKIFGTKKDLFIAAMERVYDLTLMAFQQGLQQNRAEPLSGMGEAFKTLIDDKDEMSFILQCMATVDDPDVQRVARRRFRELYDFVREHGQVDDVEVQKFLGHGFYLTFVKSIDFDPANTNAD